MAAKKRRVRSSHPGVVLKKRKLASGRESWRGCFVDPDTGKEVRVTLDPVALSTKEARRLWAIRKSKELAKRRMDLEVGVTSTTTTKPLPEALDGYRCDARNRLRGKTLQTYELAFDNFAEWTARENLATTGDLTRARLSNLREYLIALPKKAATKGGKRGERRRAIQLRSPVSVNRDMRSIKTLLNRWRVADLLPMLNRDDIADTLKALPTDQEQPDFLDFAQLQQLLKTAIAHDAAVYRETREEHAGQRPKGTTQRYTPIAPFIAFLLLSGCRRGEALALQWKYTHLDATDPHGRVVGEIRLPATITKTRRARTVGLEVSPALRSLLAQLRPPGKRIHEQYVFGGAQPYTADMIEKARQRLIQVFDGPPFDYQLLRSTCDTYLTNSPGIYGSATTFMAAKQLGHSVTVAERHYWGVIRGIPTTARSLEEAMQISEQIDALLADQQAHDHG